MSFEFVHTALHRVKRGDARAVGGAERSTRLVGTQKKLDHRGGEEVLALWRDNPVAWPDDGARLRHIGADNR